MIDWAYRTGRRPLKEYLIHLGLYDSAFDAKGVLRRRKTSLPDSMDPHVGRHEGPLGTRGDGRAAEHAGDGPWPGERGAAQQQVAVAEAAVGLGILIAMFRNKGTVLADEIDLLKW